MLIAVCSDRGAPGSTTSALALAAARGLPAVVAEADPYGGDLAVRCRVDGDPLPPTPTVLGLGAGRAERPSPQSHVDGSRRHLDLWRDGSHRLSELVRVVPGFLTAELGASLSWAAVASVVESQLVPVFADLGRIHAGSPSLPIAAGADVVVPVCRADVVAVQHLIWRLEQLIPVLAERNGRPPLVMPVVVSPRRIGSRAASQVAALLAETGVGPTVRGVGWLAWDPIGVSRLYAGGDPMVSRLSRSPLLRSARRVGTELSRVVGLDLAEPGSRSKISLQTWRRRPTETGDWADPPEARGGGSSPSFVGLRRVARPVHPHDASATPIHRAGGQEEPDGCPRD